MERCKLPHRGLGWRPGSFGTFAMLKSQTLHNCVETCNIVNIAVHGPQQTAVRAVDPGHAKYMAVYMSRVIITFQEG